MSSGLIYLTSAEIADRVGQQKLFGVDLLRKYLFSFCKAFLNAQASDLQKIQELSLSPSVLLYGVPNTGKTTLCYLLFQQLKKEVTNEINFYSVDVGRMLDPSLGQSSRNLETIFDELKAVSKKGSSVFLVLDELDAFCMSRSRTQEHDAIRRAMTTLMLELDKLYPAKENNNILIFGITNVRDLLDTAVVRRFSLKQEMQPTLDQESFKDFVTYLSHLIDCLIDTEVIKQLYDIHKNRQMTAGDVKNIYKEIYIDSVCNKMDNKEVDNKEVSEKIISLFKKGFSTGEHLAKTKEELAKS